MGGVCGWDGGVLIGNKAFHKESLKVNWEESVENCLVSRYFGNFSKVRTLVVFQKSLRDLSCELNSHKVGLCEPSDAISSWLNCESHWGVGQVSDSFEILSKSESESLPEECCPDQGQNKILSNKHF